MRLDLLHRHVADLGLLVEWGDLGDHRRGEYHRAAQLIVLNRRLTVPQATATLSHELGHHEFGDTCSTPHAEERAWEYGAALVISPEQYEAAERVVGHSPLALASELEVTPLLIEAWRRWYARTEPLLTRRRLAPLQA